MSCRLIVWLIKAYCLLESFWTSFTDLQYLTRVTYGQWAGKRMWICNFRTNGMICFSRTVKVREEKNLSGKNRKCNIPVTVALVCCDIMCCDRSIDWLIGCVTNFLFSNISQFSQSIDELWLVSTSFRRQWLLLLRHLFLMSKGLILMYNWSWIKVWIFK